MIPVVLLLLLLLTAPAAAAPTWSEPQAIAPAGSHTGKLAMDARGNALVTWAEPAGAGRWVSGYRWWRPADGWGPVRHVLADRGVVIAFEITPLGEATFMLERRLGDQGPVRLSFAAARPGEAIGDFETVTDTAAGQSSPQVAFGIDDVGNAVAAWIGWRDPYESGPRPGFVATRRAGGRFGEPQHVGEFHNPPSVVAINPAGAAAVAWRGSSVDAKVLYRPPGAASFGPPEDPGGLTGNALDLAIDPAGRVLMSAATPYFNAGPESRARFAVRSPLGDWSEPRVLDAEGFVAKQFVEPTSAPSFLIARSPESGSGAEAHFATVRLDGRLDDQALSEPPISGLTGSQNLRGDILAAWERLGDGNASEVVVRERGFLGGPFTPATTLARSHPGGVLDTALNDAGQAAVVWAEGRPDPQASGPGPLMAVVRHDPALPPLPLPPDIDIYADPLAELDEDGDLLPTVRCSVSCKVRAAGIVFPGGDRRAIAGNGRSTRVGARKRRRLKLDFGADGARAVREALGAGLKPWVSVSVSARGRSPRPLVVSRRYKLRP